jgi:hypothetical protein
VATVHLVVSIIFVFIRQVVVNRIVDAEVGRVAASLVPGFVVAGCVLAVGLPVRLATDGGALSMLSIVAAGAVGGLLGLGLSRSARAEAVDLVAKLRG